MYYGIIQRTKPLRVYLQNANKLMKRIVERSPVSQSQLVGS